jgi:transposase, IS5 family
MLRVSDPQTTIWDALLPEEAKRLSDELAHIDTLLEDERFITPYRKHFDARIGRPSIPIETLLRMLYLKHRYQLGYESLCKEVSDSITWRRFCRIPLDKPVPHPTTLIKLVRRCGTETIDALNGALLTKLVDTKVLRGRKLRVDTTVLQADIDHPTDADLLEKAVRKIGRLARRIKARGAATRTKFRDRGRSAGKRMKMIGQTLRRRMGDARAEIDRLTGEVAGIARRTRRHAEDVLRNAARKLRERPTDGRLRHLVETLSEMINHTDRLLDQAAQRLDGNLSIPDRMVSLADPEARPIRRGKPETPTEFGYKVFIGESSEGFVVVHETYKGNPSDVGQIIPAVEKVKALIGKAPETVVGDRGFGTAKIENELLDIGVKRVGIPRQGKPGKARTEFQRTRSFERMRRWRIGIEARISHLNRGFGMKRARLRRIQGAKTWTGLSIFAYNLNRSAAVA